MLKNILLAATITLTGLTAISTPASASNFSAKKMTQTTVDSLEFKDVMRGLYAGKMMQVNVDDEELLKYPYIGLNDGLYDRDDPSYITYTVALMHPVISYQNHNVEDRYLVIIEKVEVHESGYFLGCTGCGAYADFFIFKDLPDGTYQLVSRTARDGIFAGMYGRFRLDLDGLTNNMQLMGYNLSGAIYRLSSHQMGHEFSKWRSLLLSENDYIQNTEIDYASDNNLGNADEDSPLHYSFDSTYKVINDGSKYFPIQVHYFGEMPIGDDYQNIRRVNKTETFYYNKAKNEYSKTKPRK